MPEAEIWTIVVLDQPRPKIVSRPNFNSNRKLGLVKHTCHPSEHGKCKTGRFWLRCAWAKSETLSPKQPE
jgi:hypothetical protein